MFTLDHLGSMTWLIAGLKELLEDGNARDIEMVAEILHAYCDRNCSVEADPLGFSFPAIAMEIGAIYAAAAQDVEGKADPYKGVLIKDESRFFLALRAAALAIEGSEEEVTRAYGQLSAKAMEPAAAEGPQVVKPARKGRRKAKAKKAA